MKALIIGGTVALLVAFVLGVIFTAAVLTHQDALFVYVTRLTSKKSNLTEKARLPDDMRETAQNAADDFKRADFDGAAACYQTIISKCPDCLYAWSNLGVIRFQQAKYDDAKVALLQSVALSPNDAFSWANLGISYYQLKQYPDAVGALEKAVELNPTDAKSHNYLGCCYSQLGQQKRAEEEYRRAIELNRSFGDAYFNLALVAAVEKPPNLGEARTDYQRALDLGVAKDPRLERMLADANGTK